MNQRLALVFLFVLFLHSLKQSMKYRIFAAGRRINVAFSVFVFVCQSLLQKCKEECGFNRRYFRQRNMTRKHYVAIMQWLQLLCLSVLEPARLSRLSTCLAYFFLRCWLAFFQLACSPKSTFHHAGVFA